MRDEAGIYRKRARDSERKSNSMLPCESAMVSSRFAELNLIVTHQSI